MFLIIELFNKKKEEKVSNYFLRSIEYDLLNEDALLFKTLYHKTLREV